MSGIPISCELHSSHRKHRRTILEGVGQTRYTCVVWQTGVAVARGQCRVEEGLLGGVVCLGLALLWLGQSGGWGWR